MTIGSLSVMEEKLTKVIEKNICRLFHILAPIQFTTNGRELDYYQHEVNIGGASRVAKRLST